MDDAKQELLVDKTGREIHVGDVLKVFHFIGPRRKRYYMYKLVVDGPLDNGLFKVSHLDLSPEYYWLRPQSIALLDYEIVQGYGGVAPGGTYEDRPKHMDMVNAAIAAREYARTTAQGE